MNELDNILTPEEEAEIERNVTQTRKELKAIREQAHLEVQKELEAGIDNVLDWLKSHRSV